MATAPIPSPRRPLSPLPVAPCPALQPRLSLATAPARPPSADRVPPQSREGHHRGAMVLSRSLLSYLAHPTTSVPHSPVAAFPAHPNPEPSARSAAAIAAYQERESHRRLACWLA